MRFAPIVLLLALGSPAIASTTPGPPSFISDDFARARTEANRRKLPMFVDVWAPW